MGTLASGPTIGSVTLGLDSTTPVITWNVTGSAAIQTSSITIDGGKVSTVYGPYGSGNNVTYAAAVGTLSAGSHTYVITATDVNGAQATPVTATFAVGTVTNGLTVSVNPSTFAENAGSSAATGTVTRQGPTTAALAVNLSSSDLTEATVPATVTIPAGQSSATFAVAAVDDTVLDGTQTVTITASAAGYTSGTASVQVTDNEAAVVTIGGIAVDMDSPTPVITWNVTGTAAIQTSSITIDGGKVSTVYGPYGSGNNVTYAAAVGTLSAGSHTYVITANDVNGVAATPATAGFTVATPPTTGPTIVHFTLGLDSPTPVITWNVTDSAGIQSSSITIDGWTLNPVYGPYGTANNASYAVAVSALSSGSHEYVITATDVNGVAEIAGNFIAATGGAEFESHLIIPAAVSQAGSKTISVEYSNPGDTPIPAPLLMIGPSTPNADELFTLKLPTLNTSLGYSSYAEILASGQQAGLLNPGESITVPVYFYSNGVPASNLTFGLAVYDQTNTSAVGWSSLQASLQPSGMSTEAWNALFASLTTQLGSGTWGNYVQMLDNNASYLGQLGENITDASQLWQFALAQADGLTPTPQLASVTDLSLTTPVLSLDFSRTYNESISSRNTSGPLGYGWRDSWQYSVTNSSGMIDVTMPSGAVRGFTPTSSSTSGSTTWVYYSASDPGDYATVQALFSSGNIADYFLLEPNGQYVTFNANGTFSALTDASRNNGIVAGYTNGQMTSLSQSSSGQSLAIKYNTAGLISSVASSDGRTVNYSYDANGHLTSVESYDGQYTYYYYSLLNVPNALTEILSPSGVCTLFGYYPLTGRLFSISVSGSALQDLSSTDYSYSPSSGEVNVTDAGGNVTQYAFDVRGLLVMTIDPLHNVSSATYDSEDNLRSVTGPTNLTDTFNYDSQGNLLTSTNALGQTTQFKYGSNDLMTGMTDANGNATSYAYDASGNLVSTTNAGGAAETATYDAEGNPLTLLNPNGQTVTYTYNSAGQVTKQTLADGSVSAFTYDSHGNLITAVDSTGTTTLAYDSGDRLTKITYPNGQFLAYTYDSAGRRTKMVDQSGFTVEYTYDPLGRLSTLADGTLDVYNDIAYSYNNLGQLAREDKGNGTYTTYQYDADGNLQHLINYSPTNVVDSEFDYTYNALNQQTSMATLDGTWTYGYDKVGQLATAVFVSTNPAIPSQNLAYTYDANGNRIQTVISGVTTSYAPNNLNQYTTVGNTTYQYDSDGNLVSSTTGSVTTNYTYDSLNRLVSVTSPTDSWIYSYNALNELVATTHNGQLTTNLIDPTGLGNVAGTYNSSGNLVADYTYGLGLVSQVASGSENYYDFNALGSTVGLTNAAGGILNTYSYLPFGGTLSSTGTAANPFTFVGQMGVSQDGSGLINMRARSYDAVLGRFGSQDPIGVAGGTDLYTYALNDPIQVIDPAGLDPVSSQQGSSWCAGVAVDDAAQQQCQNNVIMVQQVNDLGKQGFDMLYGPNLPGWAGYVQTLYNTVKLLEAAKPVLDNIKLAPPPPLAGNPTSETKYGSSGNVISTPTISVSTDSLTIDVAAGQVGDSQTFTLSNTGDAQSTLNPSCSVTGDVPSALQVSGVKALYGNTSTTITVTASAAGLTPGKTYQDTISFLDQTASNVLATVHVAINVQAAAAAITASPNPLNITATAGTASATASFTVTNTGAQGSTLVYNTPQGSLNNGATISIVGQPRSLVYNDHDTYTVTVTKAGNFQAGQTFSGTITITSSDPAVPSVDVPVTVTVEASSNPFVGTWTGEESSYGGTMTAVIDSSGNITITFALNGGNGAQGRVQSSGPGIVEEIGDEWLFTGSATGTVTVVEDNTTTEQLQIISFDGSLNGDGTITLFAEASSSDVLGSNSLTKQ